jgi:hypothetical protein
MYRFECSINNRSPLQTTAEVGLPFDPLCGLSEQILDQLQIGHSSMERYLLFASNTKVCLLMSSPKLRRLAGQRQGQRSHPYFLRDAATETIVVDIPISISMYLVPGV